MKLSPVQFVQKTNYHKLKNNNSRNVSNFSKNRLNNDVFLKSDKISFGKNEYNDNRTPESVLFEYTLMQYDFLSHIKESVNAIINKDNLIEFSPSDEDGIAETAKAPVVKDIESAKQNKEISKLIDVFKMPFAAENLKIHNDGSISADYVVFYNNGKDKSNPHKYAYAFKNFKFRTANVNAADGDKEFYNIKAQKTFYYNQTTGERSYLLEYNKNEQMHDEQNFSYGADIKQKSDMYAKNFLYDSTNSRGWDYESKKPNGNIAIFNDYHEYSSIVKVPPEIQLLGLKLSLLSGSVPTVCLDSYGKKIHYNSCAFY